MLLFCHLFFKTEKRFGFNLETLCFPPGWGMMWEEEERQFQLEGMHEDHLFQLPDHFRCGQKFKDIMKGHCPHASGAQTGLGHGPPLQEDCSRVWTPSVQTDPLWAHLWTIFGRSVLSVPRQLWQTLSRKVLLYNTPDCFKHRSPREKMKLITSSQIVCNRI